MPRVVKDVLVWDIEDNFQLDVTAIHNIEITSEQVKDNIDKVSTVKILKFGTPQTIAIIVLKIEKFDVTLL